MKWGTASETKQAVNLLPANLFVGLLLWLLLACFCGFCFVVEMLNTKDILSLKNSDDLIQAIVSISQQTPKGRNCACLPREYAGNQ
jgi:hypothetical protein